MSEDRLPGTIECPSCGREMESGQPVCSGCHEKLIAWRERVRERHEAKAKAEAAAAQRAAQEKARGEAEAKRVVEAERHKKADRVQGSCQDVLQPSEQGSGVREKGVEWRLTWGDEMKIRDLLALSWWRERHRRIVLLCGVGIIVLMGLFPPWEYTHTYWASGQRAQVSPGPYAFISTGPRFASKVRGGQITAYSPRVDLRRLCIQWFLVTLVTGVILAPHCDEVSPARSTRTIRETRK